MRTIWLASYPKSGNTWLRMMISGLIDNEKAIDINALDARGGIASARHAFEYFLMLDSGLFTHDEAEALRPLVHAAAAAELVDHEQNDGEEQPPVHFIKTHDAYSRTVDGTPVLAGAAGAHGAILIVRDPRDVAPSLANHNGTDIDEAITFMNDPGAEFCGRVDRQSSQLRQRLAGWSGFFRSWTEQRDIPVHVVRYEDMKADPHRVLSEATAFAGWHDLSQGDIAGAVERSSFAELQQQERERGFREAPLFRPGAGRFFRRGESGAWREELTSEQVARIEAAHAPLMRSLGYAVSGDGACA